MVCLQFKTIEKIIQLANVLTGILLTLNLERFWKSSSSVILLTVGAMGLYIKIPVFWISSGEEKDWIQTVVDCGLCDVLP